MDSFLSQVVLELNSFLIVLLVGCAWLLDGQSFLFGLERLLAELEGAAADDRRHP